MNDKRKKPFKNSIMQPLFTSSDLQVMIPGIVLIALSVLLIGNKEKVKEVLSVVKTFLF